MGPGSLVKEMLRTAGSYSPECVEGSFCELRTNEVLGTSLGCAGEYDVLVTWATRGEGPSCRQKRTRL